MLALDPALFGNQSYLAPYPALASFLSAHPEIPHDPVFYVGQALSPPPTRDEQVLCMWRDAEDGLAVLIGFAMGIGLVASLIRTVADYRRWNTLSKVQAEFHAKILDRFTASNDLLAWIQSPAGSKFLQSTLIAGSPLARILWSVQGGVVLLAGGFGLQAVSGRVGADAFQPLHALGVLGVAPGLGFVVSAIISFVICFVT